MDASGLSALGVLHHPLRDCSKVSRTISDWAVQHGVRLLGLDGQASALPADATPVDEHSLGKECSLLVAVGGDGTVLRGLRMGAAHGTPVMGVNLGRLAFLAEVDPADVGGALDTIAQGRHVVEERIALTVNATAGGASWMHSDAYNDVVLTRVAGRGQAAIALEVDGSLFARYSSDGLIVSTPTGSTAYNFSANGPIVSPRVQSMMVTPVATHAAFNRTLVVHRSESLLLQLLRGSAPVVLEIDGRHTAVLEAGDTVSICVSDTPARLVRVPGRSFYERARAKLGLVDPLVIAE